MPTTTRHADPALAAVRAAETVVREAEVAKLHAVLAWAAEHTIDNEDDVPDRMSFGECPLHLAGRGAPVVEEFAAYDLAAALGLSSESGCAYLGEALELRQRLPRLWAAVTAGRLVVWKARKIARATIALPVEGAAYVDQRLAQAVTKISLVQIRRLVQEAILRFSPQDVKDDQPDRRRVIIDFHLTDTDGNVPVDAVLAAPDAHALEQALRDGAKRLADSGCEDTLDARRSMALGDLARGDQALDLGRGTSVVVHLHQDSRDVGRCETTRSPVTVETIRQWVGSAAKVFLRPVIDLNDTVHVEAYEAPDRLRRQIELRDLTCVFPHCHKPASRCDLDHVCPHSRGGATCTCNLAPLCRRHHRAKTHGAWRYLVEHPGSYRWTVPSGTAYPRDHHGTTPLGPTPALAEP
ncbi:HNH endonuclease signature motif containing protein [Nocardioides sp. GXZ039]|uniref:HNH endonuclease signature motif containing protein n=1 Tax=Nocardioides sp. GXZ039 TaxID=3136018 RepID=UPI0030F4A863